MHTCAEATVSALVVTGANTQAWRHCKQSQLWILRGCLWILFVW